MKRIRRATRVLLFTVALAAPAQQHSDVHLHLVIGGGSKGAHVPAVVWLKAINGTPQPPFVGKKNYTLLQKDRMFKPHLLVIPVGSTVDFPNADPFFHNVFSLFDGKRFDLGLYEAGSHKQVVFPREGVSYIFCNIHPEMSAVVIALSTPLYSIAEKNETAVIPSVPPGDYQLSIWVEGVPQSMLAGLTRTVHVRDSGVDLGDVNVPAPSKAHTNKFGEVYGPEPKPIY